MEGCHSPPVAELGFLICLTIVLIEIVMQGDTNHCGGVKRRYYLDSRLES